MKDKLRVIIGGVILFPHIITFLCLKMNSGGKLAMFFFFWMPGRANLHLVTKPCNVGGGF